MSQGRILFMDMFSVMVEFMCLLVQSQPLCEDSVHNVRRQKQTDVKSILTFLEI